MGGRLKNWTCVGTNTIPGGLLIFASLINARESPTGLIPLSFGLALWTAGRQPCLHVPIGRAGSPLLIEQAALYCEMKQARYLAEVTATADLRLHIDCSGSSYAIPGTH